MPVKIFLSYAREDDEPFVKRLYEGLKVQGLEVWFDRVNMPSRMLTFHQEIRDAIVDHDRLVLIVGPKTVTSNYVMQEWQFAYFEVVKCVNPIVRLNGRDTVGKPIDGYNLIPEDLRLIHAEDFRDDSQFAFHLDNLARQLNDPLPPTGKLVAVPELPAHYLKQNDRIHQLRDMVLAGLRKPVVVSGAAGRVGLQGMGGIGKSVLAAALAHHPEIQRGFPGGVYWVTLGQDLKDADLVERQRWLAHQLDGKDDFNSVDSGKERLRELLKDRAGLLVLDDVWKREDAEAFNVLGPRCRLLLTTRDAGLVTALAAKENHFQVQLPTESEARFMLAKAAGIPVEELPVEAGDVISECGRLPLALAICGGMVRGRESGRGVPWRDLLEALREHDLEFLSDAHPGEEQHASIWKAINIGLRALPENLRTRFAELAVFGLDTGALEDAVVTLWEHTAGLRPRESRKLLAEFTDRSLVQRPKEGRMELHDLLHNFASGMVPKQFGSLEALHQRLIEAYRKKCSGGWPSGPNDGYFLETLVHHLIAASQADDAVALLTDLPWIEAKCKAGLAFRLQEDYRETIAALPEAQAELQEEERRKAELARWTQTLIECAEQKRLPKPEEIIMSVEPWTKEQIEAESKRIIENPTRLDRLKAFAGFVEQELNPLDDFGERPGFVVQHAFNSAPRGPVHLSATQQLETVRAPLLLRRWSPTVPYNPKPALLRTLEGHTGSVMSVSVTPDGRRAVSGGGDQTLRVWNLETGESTVFQGHTGSVHSVSVTPDGLRAVSGSEDQTLRVWDLDAGACLGILEGHAHPGYYTLGDMSVSVTPDGRLAVSASWDKTLRVWDLETRMCLRILEGHADAVWCVVVTPDGRRAVSGSADQTLRAWDLDTGACLSSLEGHLSSCGVSTVSATPDGRRAVSGSEEGLVKANSSLRVWDLERGVCLRTLEGHRNGVPSVSVTPDGRRAISGSRDHTLRVWDLETGVCLRTLEGHTSEVTSVSVTPDGRRAVSGSKDHTLRVWDLETGVCLRTLEGHTSEVTGVSVTPDGRRAVSKSYELLVWDPETGGCLRTLEGHTSEVTGVSVTPDGRRAVSGSKDHTLRVWDLETGVCLRTLEGHTGEVIGVRVTPDGRRVVSGSEDHTLRVWDLETGVCLRTLEGHTSEVRGVSVMPDGRRAVSGSGDHTLRVWNLETGVCLRTLEGHLNAVFSVSVGPDGRRTVSASFDGTMRVWDLETGACLGIPADLGLIVSVSVGPNGQWAVSAGGLGNETLNVWDLETGRCLRTLEGPAGRVLSVSVTPDGLRAMSGSADQTLRVWDLQSGTCLAIARLTARCTTAAAVGDHRVVAGTSAGEVLFFDVRGLEFSR